MRNHYLNVNRIEFPVTFLCSGRCLHCSVIPNAYKNGHRFVDPTKAFAAIRALAGIFEVTSLMTFGGEPLIYPDITCRIHRTAGDCGIPQRQLITNGYFSRKHDVIRKTAVSIHDSGINNILISVDAFHQETIPLEFVRLFAEALLEQKIESIKFHPAWVVDASHQNRYNTQTYEILDSLSDLGIKVSHGNNIFPAGNAEKYLKEYYPRPCMLDLDVRCGETPYTDRLDDVKTLSIQPNGNVMVCAFVIGNIYTEDIAAIVERYDPYQNEMMKALMESGVKGLIDYAQDRNVTIDTADCHSACSVCRKTVAAINEL